MPIENVKERFEEMAKEYDEKILKIIPYYDEMIEALINSIPFNEKDEIKVLDLGTGTGTIAKKVKEKFPNSQVTALDLVEDMIEIAKIKLEDYNNIEYIVGDFSNFDFKNKYDVILSSLAIHHIKENKGKIELYEKIFNSLKENGVFYNADVILGTNEYSKNLNGKIFRKNLEEKFDEKRVNELEENAETVDYPSKLFEQLKWFEEIGFKDIEVIWKYYGHGVYGGKK
jgi:tRNA (cmo5U34)-methyltransferase